MLEKNNIRQYYTAENVQQGECVDIRDVWNVRPSTIAQPQIIVFNYIWKTTYDNITILAVSN